MALRGDARRWLLRAAWLTPALALALSAAWITQAGTWGRLLPAEQLVLAVLSLLLAAGAALQLTTAGPMAVPAAGMLWLVNAGACGLLVWVAFAFGLFG